MAYTAGDVITGAAVLLNDSAQQIYTNSAVLPIVKQAYEELRDKLINAGVPLLDEISNTIAIAVGTTEITFAGSLPADLIEIIEIKERNFGSSDLWSPMTQVSYSKFTSIDTTDTLQYWAWREQAVLLKGANIAKEVLIYYKRDFASIVDTTSAIGILNAKNFLIKKTAALSAAFIGENYSRAEGLSALADQDLDAVLRMAVKNNQALPAKRRPYRKLYRRFI